MFLNPLQAETAAIDGLVSSWSENISVSFCLQARGYGLTLRCALGLQQYKRLSYSYSVGSSLGAYKLISVGRLHLRTTS